MWDDFGIVEVEYSERGKRIGTLMVEDAINLLAEKKHCCDRYSSSSNIF